MKKIIRVVNLVVALNMLGACGAERETATPVLNASSSSSSSSSSSTSSSSSSSSSSGGEGCEKFELPLMNNPLVLGYVENGDFEGGEAVAGGIGPAIDGSGYKSSAPGATVTAEVARTGTYSGRVTSLFSEFTETREVVFRIWNLEPGKRYRISAYLTSNDNLAVSMELRARFFHCILDPTWIDGGMYWYWQWSGFSGVQDDIVGIKPGSWTKAQIDYLYQGYYQEIFLYFDAQNYDVNDLGEYFIDDIEIEEIQL